MINSEMRYYNFYLMNAADEYGQEQYTDEIMGSVKMAIYESSLAVINDVRYKDATYIGLTPAALDDTYIIQYGEQKLKVLYAYSKGRLKQVFLKEI